MSNDDKARAVAKKLLADYQIAVSRAANGVSNNKLSTQKAAQYAVDARNHAAEELAKLAKGKGISSAMRQRIENVTRKVKGHTGSGHGAWWASSGSSDNPSSWI